MALWQPGKSHPFLNFVNIIFDTVVFKRLIIWVVQHEGGSGITITGLTNRAGIDDSAGGEQDLHIGIRDERPGGPVVL